MLLQQKEDSKVPFVLVVEDHPALRELIETVLNDAGYGVKTVANAELAISAASEHAVDLLLTDLRMPGMDGTSLARIFQTQHRNAGVVLMSGSDPESLQTQASGVHFLRKPFTSKSLLAIVSQSIAESLQSNAAL
jgi:CheY-like chemotaxis protein